MGKLMNHEKKKRNMKKMKHEKKVKNLILDKFFCRFYLY